ncbi:MAG: outer membrane protein transport protein [Cytophagales bacterium]|nr:outer membrane protein transport protein [Cytophagales bacterium]
MKRKVGFAIIGLVLLGGTLRAQSYVEEALMVSRIQPGGTARIQAMGGVQNALGGDISTAFYNPAGLGMFNKSDFSFSPAYVITNYASSYLGNKSSDTRNNLIIPNLGVAFHSGQDGQKGIWGGTFGINFNRINSYNETFTYSGTNADNSIIDYFINKANGTGTSQFGTSGFNYNSPTGLAYFNYLVGPQDILSPPGPADQYFTDVTGVPLQKEVVKNSGAQNQWSLSYGVNFKDKIFLGAGVGITTLTYKSEKIYSETFSAAGQPMSFMKLTEALSLDGTGINLTAGAIYRPMNRFQLGFSAATPTSYEINDNYSASMSTSWNAFVYQPGKTLNEESASTDNVSSTYTLVTPWRLSLGLTYFFGKHGFISADTEWLNYSKTKYTGSEDYSSDNNLIRKTYQTTFNIRAGGEFRLDKYRFRAGYSLMPDPFQTSNNNTGGLSIVVVNNDRSISSITTGAGYRTEKFYIDLALIFTSGDTSYRPYQLNYALDPLVTQSKKTTTIMVTVGIPF